MKIPRIFQPLIVLDITQSYGENPMYYGQWGLPGHNGVDFRANIGTLVYSPCEGRVLFAGRGHDYGNHIIIASKEGYYHLLLAHLSEIFVNTGQLVGQRDHLGRTGNTGNSTGPHLHFGVYIPSLAEALGHKGMIDPMILLKERTPMHSRICPHIQLPRHEPYLKAFVQQSKVRYAKILDPDRGEADPYPGVTTIGRLTFPNNDDTRMVSRGREGAVEWGTAVRPRIAQSPWINIWELPNEFVIANGIDASKYVDFTFEAVRQLQVLWSSGYRFKITAPPLSTGNPPKWAWEIIGEIFGRADETEEALDLRGLVHYGNTHEYGMRDMHDLYSHGHLLRYRTAFEELRRCGWRVPKWFISETGIDLQGNGKTDGWSENTEDPSDFMFQLEGYDTQVQEDPEIMAIFPFTHMAASTWPSFNINERVTKEYFLPYLVRKNYGQNDVYGDWLQQFVLPWNVDSAFAKYAQAQAAGWTQMSPEIDRDGKRFQVWYSSHDNTQHVIWARIGEWANVHHFDREN